MQGISERIQRRVPRIRDARDTRKDAMTKPRFKEVVPNAKHPSEPRLSTFSRSAPGTPTRGISSPASRRCCQALADWWQALTDALSDTATLAAQVTRLSAELERTRLDRANLRAAMRATLAAYADGEPDPLWYLRDELNAPQTPATASRRPT